jgi:sugar phosphate permease
MKRALHYAWIVAAATFFVAIAAVGVRSSQTMLILPLESEFGLRSGAMISAAIAVNIALLGLAGPFVAGIYDRFGVRRTVGIAMIVVGIMSAASTLVTAVWQLIPIWGVGMGIAVGGVGGTLGATIVTRWFEKHRGLIIGVFSAATQTGQLIFLPLYGWLIQNHSWRYCALAIAALCFVVAPLFMIVMRERPSDVGLTRLGAHGDDLEDRNAGVNPFRRAIDELRACATSRNFWLLASSFFICGASTNGLIGTHLIPACGDHGIPETRAAGLLVTMGLFDLVGTTASGWFSDRYNGSWLLFWYYGLRGLSLIFLPLAFGAKTLGLPIFAVFYGLDWIATVPPTLKLTLKTFGAARTPIIFGWILAMHQLGASAIAFVAGLIRVSFGSYDAAFVTSGILCCIAAVAVVFIRTGERAEVPAGAATPAIPSLTLVAEE